jgi:hypothetical protein
MIEYNAGTFSGDIILEKIGSYRDGDVKVQVRVVKTENSQVLLQNVNHVCQATFEIEGTTIKCDGELVHLGTYRNGGIGIDLVVKNDAAGQKLLSKAKDSGTAVINFSSNRAESSVTEEPGQPNLDGLEHGDE